MERPSVGWIAAIYHGGIAGWLASSSEGDMGLLMNIMARLVGAADCQPPFSASFWNRPRADGSAT